MWRLPGAPVDDRLNLSAFVAAVNANADMFQRGAPLALGRAPGRLDLMGGIADYSGALVLELPLACATVVAAQPTAEPVVTVRSLEASIAPGDAEVAVPLAALAPGGTMREERAAHALLTADPGRAWAAYAIGPLVTLARSRGLELRHGLRLLVSSTVPSGKGVSSSAALEVAALQAIRAVLGVELDGRELALLCQRAENLVVGAPCGVMDQITVACGEVGQLLALRCQPAELEPTVALPEGLEVWGIDSGIRHSVGGSDYGTVRTAAFMGYRIIAALAGLPVASDEAGRVAVRDQRWGGYLANLAPAEWEQQFRPHIPEQLTGDAFLAAYGGITDTATRVEPARSYPVRAATAHPIWEHHRVRLFRALLLAGAQGEEARVLLGELMGQAHASYSACGLGSAGTDLLVALAREAGPAAGVYGAKITGGGSGGTVAVLARRGSEGLVRAIARRYAAESGAETFVLGGTSPGALAAGITWLVGA